MSRWLGVLAALALFACACSDDTPADDEPKAGSAAVSGAGTHAGGAGEAGMSGSGGASSGNGGSTAGAGGSLAGNGGDGGGSGVDGGSGSNGGSGNDGGGGGTSGGSGSGQGGSAGAPSCDPGFHLEGTMCVADPTCPEVCTPDASECSGGNARRCVRAGSCWIWSGEASCGAGGCDGDHCAGLGPGVTVDQWGTSGDDIVFGLQSGAAGEVLATGYTCGLLDAQSFAGECDLFVSSRNQSTAENWTREWGTKALDKAHAVVRSASGDVFVGGYARGSFATGDVAPDDFFVTKWSADGVHQWDTRWGSTGGRSEEVFALALGDDGSVFAGGVTEGDIEGANAGMGDAFLSKLDASGAVLWTRQWGTSGDDIATALAVDSSGAVYVAGYTGGAIGGQTSAGQRDAFLQKRTATDGAVVWTRQLGSTADDDARGVAIGTGDVVFVTGAAGGSFGRSGSGGAYLGKWQADGSELWVEQWGPGGTLPWAVQLNAAGDVYVAGAAFGTIDGATNAGSGDAFVSKWTQAGTSTRARAWSQQYGTDQNEFSYGLAVHPDGAVYVGGGTYGAFPGYGNRGETDLFVIRIPE